MTPLTLNSFLPISLGSTAILISKSSLAGLNPHHMHTTYFYLLVWLVTAYVSGPAKINHVRANYLELYFC